MIKPSELSPILIRKMIKKALDLPGIKAAVDLAAEEERAIFLVGGTVRDLLLKRPVRDIDLAVTGDLTSWIHRLAQRLKTRIVTMGKESFQTFRLPLKNIYMDIWEIRKATLEEDAWRRDFSINSIYLNLRSGELYDPALGLNDVKRKTIRMLSLSGFRDDPVRMLRAIRFKMCLPMFSIDRSTFSALQNYRYLLSGMPGERISQELDEILKSANPYEGLLLLDETGLLGEILPELNTLKGVMQNMFHPDDVFNHTLNSINFLPEVTAAAVNLCGIPRVEDKDRLILVSSLLLHDAGKPACQTTDDEGEIHFYNHEKVSMSVLDQVSRRLRWSRERTERIRTIIRFHLVPTHLYLSGCPEKGIRKMIHQMGEDLPLLVLHYLADRFSRGQDDAALQTASIIMETYRRCREEVISPEKLVSGKDVMDILGLSPGPEVGKVLQSIVRRQVEGEVRTRDEAIAVLKDIKRRHNR